MSSKSTFRSKNYIIFMFVVLTFVQILDTYAGYFTSAVVSNIRLDFFPTEPTELSRAIMVLGGTLASLGAYLAVLVQYMADKVGRKPLLLTTVFGMALSAFLMMISPTYPMYVISYFTLFIFAGSDVWLIYINEESSADKKAFWSNIVMIGGATGVILMSVFRMLIDLEVNKSAWRLMAIFPVVLGLILGIIILFTIKETVKYQEVKEKNQKISPDLQERQILFRKNFDIILRNDRDRRNAYLTVLILYILRGFNEGFIRYGEDFLYSTTLSSSDIDIVVLMMSISAIFGYLITGLLADKIGRKPLLYVYIFCIPFGIILLLVGVRIPSAALTLACLAVLIVNTAYWGLWILCGIIIIEILPTEARGTGSGLKIICAAIFGTLVGILNSFIVLSYSYELMFLFPSLLLFLTVPLIIKYLKETKGTDLSEVS